MNQIVTIEDSVYGTKDSFASVLSDRSINFDREAEFALQTLYGNDYAMKIAMQNRSSLIAAVVNIAAIGISLNPAKKQAYLVPRDGKICLDISYMGLMDLAIDSGSIRWGQAELVYENDTFGLNGIDQQPTHIRNPFAKDRGEVVGVYVVVKTADGDYLTDAMSVDEINAIRDRSSAWKAWVSKKKSCPWVTDWGEMAKKTVVKRAYKYWPKTERLETAIHHLNTDGGEGLAVIEQQAQSRTALPPPEDTEERIELYASLQDIATAGVDALGEAWGKLTKEQRAMIGQAGLTALKAEAEKADAELVEPEGAPSIIDRIDRDIERREAAGCA
ncbi:recombinase RecT [Stenotrophomonas maltophilia]|uniref:recombinase RecT n=1 Tax=Stenotrophomonas maltophilia TaxID=40324 RepID=UPI0015DEF115|nr:recombinase RecT [Stenotrophomonas maltophilia]MBA0293896.1 DNA recombinase [Stenotrophomonas maltophilia]HDS1142888.1 recombinase RecT [Stenotrophomonas maltophilia]